MQYNYTRAKMSAHVGLAAPDQMITSGTSARYSPDSCLSGVLSISQTDWRVPSDTANTELATATWGLSNGLPYRRELQGNNAAP